MSGQCKYNHRLWTRCIRCCLDVIWAAFEVQLCIAIRAVTCFRLHLPGLDLNISTCLFVFALFMKWPLLMWLLDFRHEDLLSQNGDYADMWQQQLTKGDTTSDENNGDDSPSNSAATKTEPPPPATRQPKPPSHGNSDHAYTRHGHGHGRNHWQRGLSAADVYPEHQSISAEKFED